MLTHAAAASVPVASTEKTNIDRANEQLRKCSASKITAYEECPRRWFNGYVLGEREPASTAMQRGTDIHSSIEQYLKTGVVPPGPYEAMVRSAIPHLPAPGKSTVRVEEWIELPTYEGGPLLVGKFDSIDADDGHPLQFPLVVDCKTTSDFKWAKSPAQLADNIQLGAYAAYLLANTDKFPGLLRTDAVRLRHVYIRTKGAHNSMPVEVVVDAEAIADRWERTKAIVREMAAWAQAYLDGRVKTADDLPPNTNSCELYGGCFYRPKCGFSLTEEQEKQRRKSIMDAQKTNGTPSTGGGLIAKMKAQREAMLAKAQQTTPAPTTPQDLPTPAPQVENTAGSLATSPQASTPAPAPTVAASATPSIVPPDAPLRSVPRETDATCPTCLGKKYIRFPEGGPGAHRPCTSCVAPAPGDTPQTAPQATQAALSAPVGPYVPPPEAAPPKRGRGRPRKDPNAVTPKQVVAEVISRTTDEIPNPAEVVGYEQSLELQKQRAEALAAKEKAIMEASAKLQQELDRKGDDTAAEAQPPKPVVGVVPYVGPVLYVDCVPARGAHVADAVAYESFMEPIADDVAERASVADWRQIPYTAEGDLKARLREVVAAVDMPAAFVVTGTSRMRAVFLEVLMPRASAVVMGTR